MLFGLSVQGNAPKFLTRVSRRGVPINSLMLLSGAITSLVVLTSTIRCRKKRLVWLMALQGSNAAVELDYDLAWRICVFARRDATSGTKHSLRRCFIRSATIRITRHDFAADVR